MKITRNLRGLSNTRRGAPSVDAKHTSEAMLGRAMTIVTHHCRFTTSKKTLKKQKETRNKISGIGYRQLSPVPRRHEFPVEMGWPSNDASKGDENPSRLGITSFFFVFLSYILCWLVHPVVIYQFP
jgi:hypothetical protein